MKQFLDLFGNVVRATNTLIMVRRMIALIALVIFCGSSFIAHADQVVSVSVVPATQNTDGTQLSNAIAQGFYYGQDLNNLTHAFDVGAGPQTFNTPSLTPGTWFFEMTTKTATAESARSNPASFTVPAATTPPPDPNPQPPPSDNLALNKPTAVSSIDGDYGLGKYATDGNTQTRWAADRTQPTAWIAVDLGASYSLSRVHLSMEVSCAKTYTVDLSADGSAWTVVGTVTNNSALENDIPFVASGRYVRISISDRCNGSFGASIWEFQVFGSSPVTPPPTSKELCLVDGISSPFTRPVYAKSASGSRGAKLGDLFVGPVQPVGLKNPVSSIPCSCTDFFIYSSSPYALVSFQGKPAYVAACKTHGVQ